MKISPLAKVKAKVTIVIDNAIMEFVPDSGIVKRRHHPKGNFLAEHGFAALVETDEKLILIDTGASGVALEHNLSLLDVNVDDIDIIFFSHGHKDHTGGLNKIKGKIIAHPEIFRERYIFSKDGRVRNLTSPMPDVTKHFIEFHTDPVLLAEGVITTGEIPRKNDWEGVTVFKIKENGEFIDDTIPDDQGAIINTDKGLVIIQGCSHSGIINTIEAAKSITGVDEIYCVIGGFHLIGPGEKNIDRTISEFRRLDVKKVIPIHCSGFKGIKQISEQLPDRFEYCTTECEIEF